MSKPTTYKRRLYRKRAAKSLCRNKTGKKCLRVNGCKKTRRTNKRKTYCRKSHRHMVGGGFFSSDYIKEGVFKYLLKYKNKDENKLLSGVPVISINNLLYKNKVLVFLRKEPTTSQTDSYTTTETSEHEYGEDKVTEHTYITKQFTIFFAEKTDRTKKYEIIVKYIENDNDRYSIRVVNGDSRELRLDNIIFE